MADYPIEAFLSDDYAHSANTLFHFVKEMDYLKNILVNMAIVPRYCIEDIDYLNLEIGNKKINKIAVLQKCFCDIPIHKIKTRCFLKGNGEMFEALSTDEKYQVERNCAHTDFYGEYAIAFSKKWGEKNNLQPIQYLNPQSLLAKSFVTVFNNVIELDDLLDEISDYINQKLAFIKPLRGTMQRQFSKGSLETTIEFFKNFHDEQEWRYVPKIEELEKLSLDNIISNTNWIGQHLYLKEINKGLESNKYEDIWLKYRYEEIRYIIVPDMEARAKIINIILDIDNAKFENKDSSYIQKQILISKILVLEEIRRDW